MPRLSAKYRALKQIALLSNSDSPAEDIVRSILDVAGDVVGGEPLALVRFTGGTGADVVASGGALSRALRTRYRKAASRAVEAQADAAVGSEPADGPVRLCAFPVGRGAALVGDTFSAQNGGEEFLEAVAAQIGVVIERERLRRSARSAGGQAARRIEEVATIYEIGQAINSIQLEQVLRLIVEKAAAVMDAQACSLLLRDPGTETLTIEASFGLSEDIVKGARVRYGEGIAGKVAQTGGPMLILDVSADPRFAGEMISPRSDVVSSICAPLKNEVGDIIGVLSIRRHVPSEPFTEDDLKLFCVFAGQAALAITNAQLYKQLNSRIQEMAIVSDLLRAISSTLDLDRVLNQIADNIMGLAGFDRCCLYLRDPRTDDLVAAIVRGSEDGAPPEDRVRYGEGMVGVAAKERIPMFTESARLGPNDPPDASKPRQWLALPIIARDASIGAVLVDNEATGRPIRPESVELLSTFVNQAGIAIENARLYEAMEQKYAELNVLYEQSRAIGSAYGLENAAALLVDVAMRAIKCDSGALFLLDERRQEARLACAAGVDEDARAEMEKLALTPDAAHAVRRLRDPFVIAVDDGPVCPLGDWEFLERVVCRYGSVVLTPLIAEDAAVGVLMMARSSDNVFHSGDVKLASIIVSHAAVVLKNAIRYEERMREKTLELSALYEFATRISSASSLEEALASIVSIVTGIIQCDECVIYAIDYEGGLASAKACRFVDGSQCVAPDYQLDGDSIVSWVIRERKALVSPNILEDVRFAPASKGDPQVMSLMSIPLMVQDEVVGVLNVHSYSPHQYTEDDVRVLSIIASQSAAIYKELEALSALTSYTDNILSSIAAGVATLDSEGVILTWNKAAEQIVGLKCEDAVGRPCAAVIQSLDIGEAERTDLMQAIDGVLRTGDTYQGYKLCFHPQGREPVYLNLSASQLVNSGGDRLGLVVIFEEITREIEMEDQFRRMRELAAVGQLAASIAHELRNPLSSIKGAAQYLQKEYEDHSAIVEFLNIIIEEVNGLNKITTEFLDFARPIQLEIAPLNVNDAVEKTLQLMNVHISDSRVSVTQRLAEGLPEIQADEKQINQALRNVIINGIQAMPSGGEMTIETKPLAARSGVELWVHDTGVGISEERLDKIFIPFFTTKTKGTGLGLSVVRKIVENHGGRVAVRSVVNQGTSFGLILPATGASQAAVPEPDSFHRASGP